MRCLFSVSMPLRAHLISLYKLSPNQTFTLTEKCCPGEKEICKDRLSVFLRCSAESGKKLDHLHANAKILFICTILLCVSIKKKKHWCLAECGEWLPQVKRNSCQNVNIVLLVDKHATYTLWGLKQVSGLFFFFLCQPAAWPCVAISWDIK